MTWYTCIFTDPLVVLLLLDLFHLVQKLSDSQLQFGEFVFSCNFRVVVGMFSDLNIQMHSLQHWDTDCLKSTCLYSVQVQSKCLHE